MTHGWQEVTLSKVLTERKETPTPESLENGEVSIVSKIGFNEGKIELRPDGKTKTGMILARPGDLVISGINATKGAIAIYPETARKPIAATIHYGAYIPNKDKVEIKYLWWFLRSAAFRDIVQHHIPGGIKTELKSKRFLAVPVPLPPLKEQQRILVHIESMAARVNEAQYLREEAGEESRNLIKTARNKIVERLRKTNKIMTLSELCSKITDGPHISPTYVSKTEGVAFISARNISETGYDFSTAQYVSRKDYEEFAKRVNIEKGDVLLIKVGATTGTARRVDIDIEFNIWVNVALLKPRQDIIFHAFMEHMLNAPAIKEHTLSMTFGSATPYIGLGKIGKIEIPIPSLDEQWHIVAYLDGLQAKINGLRKLQSETEKELNALMPSILDKAFKGKL